MRRITILALLATIGFAAGCQSPKPDPRRCNWRMEDAGICPLPPLFWRA